MQKDSEASKQRSDRQGEETDASGGRFGREEQVLFAIDEHAGHARQIGDCAEVRPTLTVEDVDAIGTGVRDEQLAATWVKVGLGVIEARFGAGWHGREADVPQRHAALASTFFWQKA